MKSILAAIVNYETEQLNFLQQVINELKSFQKYKVTIVVHSNIPLDELKNIDHVNIIKLEN